jgi:oligopeptide/dipeptide ABC transporter ATP-binding protein
MPMVAPPPVIFIQVGPRLMAALLEVQNVSKIYARGVIGPKSTVALANFSLRLEEDKPTILTVAGESGSGKTTLAMLLLGFIAPTVGNIIYRGKNIWSLSGEERLAYRREVQAVFQDPFAVFNPFYTVDHLLTVPIKRFKLASSRADARARMDEALRAVGLRPEEILGRFPHQLSGGQRQRINVARALLLKPKLLIADEPVSMVDASLRANILETLRNLQRDHGVSIIYITHDLTTAYHIAQSIVVLYRGSVMEAGGIDEVIKSPQHPYTKLLIDSIPWPDLDRRWGAQPIKAREVDASGDGCRFLGRCPSAMEVCRVRPALRRLGDNQIAACALYSDRATLAPERLSETLPT